MKDIADKSDELQQAMHYVPGFIAVLGEHDQVIAKVKEKHMKSTFKFIEFVRLELKNNITKVVKETNAMKEKVQEKKTEPQLKE